MSNLETSITPTKHSPRPRLSSPSAVHHPNNHLALPPMGAHCALGNHVLDSRHEGTPPYPAPPTSTVGGGGDFMPYMSSNTLTTADDQFSFVNHVLHPLYAFFTHSPIGCCGRGEEEATALTASANHLKEGC